MDPAANHYFRFPLSKINEWKLWHLQIGEPLPMTTSQHAYEVRPPKDHRGVELISDALPFGGCGTANQTQPATQSVTQSFHRSHDAVIRVYDEAANVIDTHEHAGDFKEP